MLNVWAWFLDQNSHIYGINSSEFMKSQTSEAKKTNQVNDYIPRVYIPKSPAFTSNSRFFSWNVLWHIRIFFPQKFKETHSFLSFSIVCKIFNLNGRSQKRTPQSNKCLASSGIHPHTNGTFLSWLLVLYWAFQCWSLTGLALFRLLLGLWVQTVFLNKLLRSLVFSP